MVDGSSETAGEFIMYAALKIAEVDVEIYWYEELGRLKRLGVEGR